MVASFDDLLLWLLMVATVRLMRVKELWASPASGLLSASSGVDDDEIVIGLGPGKGSCPTLAVEEDSGAQEVSHSVGYRRRWRIRLGTSSEVGSTSGYGARRHLTWMVTHEVRLLRFGQSPNFHYSIIKWRGLGSSL